MLSKFSLYITLVVLAAFASLVAAQDPITATTSALSSYALSYIDSVPAKVDYTPTGANFTSGRNGVRQNEEIGFTFSFYGQAYTTLGIGYNGNLQWGASNVEGLVPTRIPTTGVNVPILAWFASDLNCVDGLCGGGYGYTGVAPNRQFIVRIINWTYQITDNTGTGDLDIDIVLFESSNRIEIRYYSVAALPGPEYAVTIGAQLTTSNWLAVLSANSSVDVTSYLQGRTIVLTPVELPPVDQLPSSTADSGARPEIPVTTGGSPYYSVLTADSVVPKVSFTNSGSAFTSGSNGVRENQIIGFTFQFFGVPYTHIGIGYNGNLQWGNSSVSGVIPAGIPSTSQTFPIFAWFGADLNCVSGIGGGGYGLIGEAPYRQFVIRANNWSYQVASGVGQGDIDIDIVLTETDNTIAIRYYSVSPLPSSSYRVTIGAQNGQNDDWTAVYNRATSFDVTWALQGRTLIFVPDSL